MLYKILIWYRIEFGKSSSDCDGLREPRSRYPKTISQSREDFPNEMRYQIKFLSTVPDGASRGAVILYSPETGCLGGAATTHCAFYTTKFLFTNC